MREAGVYSCAVSNTCRTILATLRRIAFCVVLDVLRETVDTDEYKIKLIISLLILYFSK